MEKTIVVSTDFSDSATNALNYACEFAMGHNFKILLTHIFTIPVSYAAEGPSLATISDAIFADRQTLKEELVQVKINFPKISIAAEMITGYFLESLQQLKKELDPEMIIIGAIREYSNLWLWDDDWLKALLTVSCPVLVIPKHIAYKPIRKIAFASDNEKECFPNQVDTIKKIVRLSGADFYVVHVTPQIVLPEENKNAAAFQRLFCELKPQYHTIENKLVIKGLAEFIQQHKIDLLIVIPRKHGLWHKLFNKSYTRQLALLDYIPVMAMHEDN
jgi:hypothetical protein